MDLFVYGTTTGLWTSDTGNENWAQLCLLSFIGGDNDNHDNQPKERRWEEEGYRVWCKPGWVKNL